MVKNAEYRPQQPATLIIGLILTNINVHFLFEVQKVLYNEDTF